MATYLDPRFKDHYFADSNAFASSLVERIEDDTAVEGNLHFLRKSNLFDITISVHEVAPVPKRPNIGNKSFLSTYVLEVVSTSSAPNANKESVTILKRRSIESVSA
jgi:hypothetical protein